MAQLVAVAGAAFTTAIGLGPQSGWIIGSIVGNILFPAEGPTIEGARLGDLSVTSSAYGAAIPIGDGTVRMAGNMIWSKGIKEVRTTEEVGGKGGAPAQTNVTYSYFATFAISFGEGVAENVLRLWADGKLIYDKTGTENDDIAKVGVSFRFYPGDEDQEPDSLIEADKGVDQTPAHRGLVYLVFVKLPLADYGNRIPSLSAEITFEEIVLTESQVLSGLTLNTDTVHPDYDRGVFYFSDTNAKTMTRVDTRNMIINATRVYTTDALGNAVGSFSVKAISLEGYIIANTGADTREPISVVDPNSLEITGTFGVGGGNPASNLKTIFAGISSKSAAFSSIGLLNTEHFILTLGGFNSAGLLKITGGQATFVWDGDTTGEGITDARIHGGCSGPEGQGIAYALGGPNYTASFGTSINLYQMNADHNAFYDEEQDVHYGVNFRSIATLAPGDIVPGATELGDLIGLWFDKTDNTLIFEVNTDLGDFIVKYDPDPDVLDFVWRQPLKDRKEADTGINISRLEDGVWADIFGGEIWAINTATGEEFYSQTGFPGEQQLGSLWFDSRTMTLIGTSSTTSITKWFPFRVNGGGITLDAIISKLCIRAGLSALDIDVTDLSSQTVPGFILSRQSTVRNAIQNLASVYFFDGIESDYILNFILRDGKSIVATIPQDELAVLDKESGEYFSENRVQEVELPHRFSITYMDRDKDYQQATHSARRILAPTSAMNSRNEMGLQVPIVLTNILAKQAAEKALYSSWIERSSYGVRLPWTYLALDASDLVNFLLDNGTLFTTRLVTVDMGIDFSLEVNSLSEDAAQYTSDVAADGGNSGLLNEFLSVPTTKLIMLCSTLLKDTHDGGRTKSVLYFFMGGYGQPGWNTGILFKSSEGTDYEIVGSSLEEMSWGGAMTALAAPIDPYITDEINTLTVFMNVGEDNLISTTQLEMLNGANTAALIHSNGVDVELIHYRDVTDNGDGSFTLAGLLRGQRGTDVFTGGHAIGDLFLLLTTATGQTLHLSLGEQDLPRHYRATTAGLLFEDAPDIIKASPLNDLKPYSVVHLTATLSGQDIILAWDRRTRVDGELKDGTSIVPLNEDSEAYEIDVFDLQANLVATKTGIVTETFTYLDADLIADFGLAVTAHGPTLLDVGFEAGSDGLDINTPGFWTSPQVMRYRNTQARTGSLSLAPNNEHMDSYAYQRFELVALAGGVGLLPKVDASVVTYTHDGFIYGDGSFTGNFRVRFFDIDVVEISLDTSPGITNNDAWAADSVSGTIPALTRWIQFECFADFNSTNPADWCFFDDLSQPTITSPAWDGSDLTTMTVKVPQISAQVGRGFGTKVTLNVK